jgi:(S)-ureidoglycine aminohydrolase
LTKPELDISYALPPGGLPAQSERLADRAVFTTAYAFIPKTVMTDIVTSALPFWEQTRLWVLARPLSGFAETFSHYLMEVGPNGGSDRPDDDAEAQHVLFVTSGTITLAQRRGHSYSDCIKLRRRWRALPDPW